MESFEQESGKQADVFYLIPHTNALAACRSPEIFLKMIKYTTEIDFPFEFKEI